MPMKRTASCHCGALSLVCKGDPALIAMCHCELCQRRTGSSYNLGAWFDKAAVTKHGSESIYTRIGEDKEKEIHYNFHFCSTCGTSVYWEAPDGGLPDMLGVAVGCFADPGFPAPTVSLYGKRRHLWLNQPGGMPCFSGSTQSERE